MDQQIEKLAARISGDRNPAHGAGRRTTRSRRLCAHSRPAGCGHQPFRRSVPGPASRAESVGRFGPATAYSRTGDSYLRSLLVQSAQYVLGRFGPDSALRRWGLKLAASGGKRGKKRAIVAVARKLAVMLHSMWRSGQPFQPFPQTAAAAAAA